MEQKPSSSNKWGVELMIKISPGVCVNYNFWTQLYLGSFPVSSRKNNKRSINKLTFPFLFKEKATNNCEIKVSFLVKRFTSCWLSTSCLWSTIGDGISCFWTTVFCSTAVKRCSTEPRNTRNYSTKYFISLFIFCC